MTLNNLISELLRFQMMTSRKIGIRKKSRFKKKDGLLMREDFMNC